MNSPLISVFSNSSTRQCWGSSIISTQWRNMNPPQMWYTNSQHLVSVAVIQCWCQSGTDWHEDRAIQCNSVILALCLRVHTMSSVCDTGRAVRSVYISWREVIRIHQAGRYFTINIPTRSTTTCNSCKGIFWGVAVALQIIIKLNQASPEAWCQ